MVLGTTLAALRKIVEATFMTRAMAIDHGPWGHPVSSCFQRVTNGQPYTTYRSPVGTHFMCMYDLK